MAQTDFHGPQEGRTAVTIGANSRAGFKLPSGTTVGRTVDGVLPDQRDSQPTAAHKGSW